MNTPNKVKCPRCNGTGYSPHPNHLHCALCNASGEAFSNLVLEYKLRAEHNSPASTTNVQIANQLLTKALQYKYDNE
jgi:hypothetical protein